MLDQGGGQYGGFLIIFLRLEGIGEFSSWVNPFPSNNGCGTVPCDPPDLWNGNGAVNTGDNGPVFTALYDGWSDTHPTTIGLQEVFMPMDIF